MMRAFFIVCAILSSVAATAQLRLPRIFSDHMVLQRDQPVRFWGGGTPDEILELTIDGFVIKTKVDKSGKWEMFYPAHPAGGPYEMQLSSLRGDAAGLSDIWFGDVWVASGQSNMEWKLGWKVNNWEEEIRDSNYPQIRFFEIENAFALTPQQTLKSGEWAVSSPSAVAEFSAVAWFFAKQNHLEKGVPVGIISSDWGGTPAEAWTSAKHLLDVPGYKEVAREVLDPSIDWELKRKQNERMDQLKWKLVGDREAFMKLGAHLLDYDDSEWEEVNLPNPKPFHDFVWVRKWFELKTSTTGRLYLGDINQMCTIFLNGQVIAEESWQDTTSIIEINPGLLKKGKNLMTIRAVNTWEDKVSIGRSGEMWVEADGKKINLEGAWKMTNQIEPELPDVEFFHWHPGYIYNQMIHPIAGYGIKGVIWYQGENNAGQPQLYNELFETMIEDWRIKWKQGDFPFLFVQLPNYMQRKSKPEDSQWAELREAQTRALALPNTGMAVIIDIGEANDIHPRNKQDVGKRLWLAARGVAFGEDLEYSGPVANSFEIKGNQVVVGFDHIGNGLKTKGAREVTGFALAGKDKKYFWAKARIDGPKVIVWSDEVSAPAFVRYAWGDNPECNLYNDAGLPAVPFRTDN